MEDISIKGIVKIFDESGKLVAEDHNMVVASGRLAIRRAFLTGKKYTFSRIILGTEGSVTTPEMTKDSIKGVASFPIQTQPSFTTDEEGNINIPISLSLEFQKATYEEYANIKELGLVIADGSNNETLFSRVVFSGYPFTKNHSYTMIYSIYF